MSEYPLEGLSLGPVPRVPESVSGPPSDAGDDGLGPIVGEQLI